jgi:menaquinone-dependent protoporphyrinogen IX oxidase
MQVLIVYGTTKGYTAKIAGKIAQIIRDGGDETEVVEGRSPPISHSLTMPASSSEPP